MSGHEETARPAAPPNRATRMAADVADEGSPRVATGHDHFWRLVAVVAVIVACGFVGLIGIDKFRTWSREDAVENTKQEARRQAEATQRLARERAAAKARERKTRASQVRAVNRQHPERFREFKSQDDVRILSSAPDASLHGLRAKVVTKNKIKDSLSGVVWKVTYSVLVPPFRSAWSMDMTFESVDAEHLAKVGSSREAADLEAHPELQRVADEQDKRVAVAEHEVSKAMAENSFTKGDPVVIENTDPRPALRGRKGFFLRDRPHTFEGGARAVSRWGECEIDLGFQRIGDPPSAAYGVIRMHRKHLRHADR